MLTTSLLTLALAATGLSQVTAPEGYRTVYITSMVDAKYVVVPKAPVKNGTTLVVFVAQSWWHSNKAILTFTTSAKHSQTK
jgi:hypothetical protein